MQTENIVSIQVKDKAADDFNEHRELYLKRTAWAGQCSSWFKPGPNGTHLLSCSNNMESQPNRYRIMSSKSGNVSWESSALHRVAHKSSLGRLGL